jgi:hypothetical protein
MLLALFLNQEQSHAMVDLQFFVAWKGAKLIGFRYFDFKIRFLEGDEVMKCLESAERELTLLRFLVLCN